jgi:hypothetical protein
MVTFIPRGANGETDRRTVGFSYQQGKQRMSEAHERHKNAKRACRDPRFFIT